MTKLWLVGNWKLTTAETVLQLVAAAPEVCLRHLATPEMATEHATDSADFVLVLQHRPREFSRSGIATLLASQPLAQFLVGLGPWCASTARSENAWPESLVVALEDMGARFIHEIQSGLRHEAFSPSLTSGRDELFLASRNASLAPFTGTAYVDSPDPEFAAMLREIVSEVTIAAGNYAENFSTLFWDADPFESRLPLLRLQGGRRGRVIAFSATTTPEIVQSLRQAGADHILGKPFELSALYQLLNSGEGHKGG